MTTEPTERTEPTTPGEARAHMVAGLAKSDDDQARAVLRRTASTYNPAYDAEADRLIELGKTSQLPPAVRTALGFHQASRKAALDLARLEEGAS